MPRRNKRSLKAISQHIESGKGFGSLSSSSDPATGVSAASEEDFVMGCYFQPMARMSGIDVAYCSCISDNLNTY